MHGSDDRSVGGLNINQSGRKDDTALAEQKAKRATDDFLFMALLDQIHDRIDDLQEQMQQRYETLKEKYGENVIDAMVAAFLPDADAGAMSEEDKLRALADKFLDENGNVKAQYAHLEEAQYVRDWNELQKHQAFLAKYEGRNDLTAEEMREVQMAANSASIAENANAVCASQNQQFKDTVDQTLDEAGNRQGQTLHDTGFKFS